MRDGERGPRPEEVAASSIVALPFVVALIAVWAHAAPTEAQWARADPILSVAPRALTLASVPILGVVLVIAWWRLARPSRSALITAARHGALGAVAAVSFALVLRLVFGPHLPSVIPPEESAGPGLLLGLTAGTAEELVCRLLLLPLLYFGARSRAPRLAAPAAVVLTALAFAMWHAVGEGTPSPVYFATRFVVPGCAMSVVWLRSPSVVVAGHCAAHLAIPALFV